MDIEEQMALIHGEDGSTEAPTNNDKLSMQAVSTSSQLTSVSGNAGSMQQADNDSETSQPIVAMQPNTPPTTPTNWRPWEQTTSGQGSIQKTPMQMSMQETDKQGGPVHPIRHVVKLRRHDHLFVATTLENLSCCKHCHKEVTSRELESELEIQSPCSVIIKIVRN